MPAGGHHCHTTEASEHAFCRALGVIAEHFSDSARSSRRSWFDAVAAVSKLVAAHGKFNFLMSDGEHLIAYGDDRLHHVQRHVPPTPGVPALDIALIATEPLTAHEPWRPFEPGELRIYRLGGLVERIETTPVPTSHILEHASSGYDSGGI